MNIQEASEYINTKLTESEKEVLKNLQQHERRKLINNIIVCAKKHFNIEG